MKPGTHAIEGRRISRSTGDPHEPASTKEAGERATAGSSADDEARAARLVELGRAAAQMVHELAVPASLIVGCLDDLDRQVSLLCDAARAGDRDGSNGGDVAGDPTLYAVHNAPEVVAICRDSAHRIRDLIDEMRVFVSGRRALHPAEPVALDELARESAALAARARADSAPPPVQIRCPADLTVRGDRGALSRVLVNLLSNAFDAVQDTPQRTVRIDVRADAGNAQAEVCISDSGVGVPTSERERVFEPFYTTKARGSGLGLAIARDVVAAHGGTIRIADRAAPRGTAVVVKLPLVGSGPPDVR